MKKKVRVYELAKELGRDSNEVIQEALAHGIDVRNHMSSLDDSAVAILRAFLEVAPPPRPAPEPEPAPVAAEAPVEEGLSSLLDSVFAETSSPAVAEATMEAAAPAPPEPVVRPADVPEVRPVPLPAAAEAAPAPVARETLPIPEAPRAPAEPPAPTAPPVRPLHPSLTETPLSPARHVVVREREVRERRAAVILGRKEIPPPPPPRPRPVPPARGPGGPPPAGGGPGRSGIVFSRVDGGKRIFVPTGTTTPRPGPTTQGRGRPPGPGGPPTHRKDREMAIKGPRPELTPDRPIGDLEGPKKISIRLPISVKDLSAALGVKANVIIKLLMENGVFADINKPVPKEAVELIGVGLEREIEMKESEDVEETVLSDLEMPAPSDPAKLVPRPPIVTFLGHVDHGKTSLLDRIRKTEVAASEHGGITQHLGAYRAVAGDGRSVVFLDTPGHRAFTEMRARGANITDVVVLVVAADDGVMPQTEEAISHAKAAEVPIVVAVNKVDKPEANVLRVKQQLTGLGLQPEEWGGKTVFVEVSAVTGQGVDQLVEYLALESDLLELRADPTRSAVATVLDARHTEEEGNVARILVTDGTLRRGDPFLCGACFGKVKAIRDDANRALPSAGPATPVSITGLPELVKAGDKFYVVSDVAKARDVAAARLRRQREQALARKAHVSLERLFADHRGATLNIIIKADVTGSLEVLRKAVGELGVAEIKPKIIHAAVGGVNETDVALADASNAVILGFHVSTTSAARSLAQEKSVEIRLYQVIYKLIDELKLAMEGRLKPEEREVITGHAEVRNTFKISRIGTIAGCYVTDGIVKRQSRVRIIRDGIVIQETQIASLKRFKDDAREVKEGLECGIVLERFDDVKVGDVFDAIEIEVVKRTLE